MKQDPSNKTATATQPLSPSKVTGISGAQAPQAKGPFDLNALTVLANRYAPIINFHPDEQYFMCTVEWYLQRATLCGPNGYSKVSPSVSDLPIGTKDDEKYWLVMTDDAKKGDLSVARTYVHAVWEEGNSYTDIQYWFCYGYNGPGTLHISNPLYSADVDLSPLGAHWIDWELVTIRVKNDTQQVLGVYLSQHGAGEWITDLSRFGRKGDQFIVYASKNGHAVYAQPGTNPTESVNAIIVSCYLRNDTAKGGQSFDSAGKLDIVSVSFLTSVVPPQWLSFPYRWGKGTDSHLTVAAITKILLVAVAPYAWLVPIFVGPMLIDVAEALLPWIKFDDTNGVHGPQMQSYWSGLLPEFKVNNGYTGLNTNNDSPPGIIGFEGLYHIFFKDHNGTGIMHITSADGITWSGAQSFYTGYTTTAGPCAVVYNNILNVFFRDGSGNGILYIQSTDGITWKPAPKWYIGMNGDRQPAAAVLNNQTLCVIVTDAGGNGIMRAVQTAPNGAWNLGYTGWNTSAPPCIVAFNNLFHIFFQDHNGKGVMHITSPDGITWSEPASFYTGFNTSAGPCAVVYDDVLYVFFRDGNGNGILYIQSDDGNHWAPAPSWYIGLNCDHEPAIALAPADASNNSPIMCLACIDAGGNGIMRSVFTEW